jgi:transposase
MSDDADTPQKLPDDIEALRAMVGEQSALVHAQAMKIAALEEELRLLLHKRFGSSSEKANPDQLQLFNEAEATAAQANSAETPDTAGDLDDGIIIPEHIRQKCGRKPLPSILPRVRVEHDIPDANKICACGCTLSRIGDDTSEQLDIVPAKIQVLQHVRFKYACRTCEGSSHDGPAVTIAPLPAQPIPKSNASPGLLAHIVTSKFVDGLPLYRQTTMFARIGVDLGRGTMANWMIRCGELVVPLINLMDEQQLAYDVLQMDETTVQVLKEEGRAAQAKSRMWVRRGGPSDKPVILFDYDPSRAGAVALRLLQDYKGFLQTDGYSAYESVGAHLGLTHVACLAHARRKFDEALKAQKATGRGGLAAAGLALIQKIYRVEKAAREAGLGATQRHQLRQKESRPLWDELRRWLDSARGHAPPSTLVGKALAYLDGQWSRLIRVLDDGRLEVDNNLCENAIRPFVLGRKSWMFADSPAGAEASARLYGLVETAKANGLEPYAYLHRVFTDLPKAKTLADVEALLPWAIAPPATHSVAA